MGITIAEAKKTSILECEKALESISDEQSERLIEAILAADQVFFIGVGRVMLSLQAICKRFAHLGIDAHCVGDITEPAITQESLLIVGSNSGESIVPVAISNKAKSLGARIAWIGSNVESTIAGMADVKVRIPVQTKLNRKDEMKSQQLMTSLFEQVLLLYGDAISRVILDKKNLDLHEIWRFHANLE